MKKRVADIITEILVENGIDTCFSVVGGGAMHLNNAFALNKNIKKIFNHHEQACSMAAEGYAKAKGKMAAVCVTSGPGGLNALTGVEGAWVDSVPMIIISGHPRYETTVAPTGLDIRYRGVQEFDIVTSIKNMTKYSKTVIEPLDIKYEMQKAIDIAMSGRRGPTWIDVPLNVQSAMVEEKDLKPVEPQKNVNGNYHEKELEDLISQIENSQRPCLLTGSGLRTSGTVEHFREFMDDLGVPVVGGALQADIVPNSSSLYFGMSGNIGPRAGNFILQNADLIVVFGNSLAIKQTGFNQKAFAPKAKIIMIDIAQDEARKPGLSVDRLINIDLAVFFEKIKKYIKKIPINNQWIDYCNKVYEKFNVFESIENIKEADKSERVPSALFWKRLIEAAPPDMAIALGNSSSIAGILQAGIKYADQHVIVNYACGSMGDDLPEAIGVSVALGREVICVTGDGSVMMNLQELQTIKHNCLPVKVVVFSNDGYGAIRQTFKNFFDGLYSGCDAKSGVSFPDFGKVADAFGFDYFHCSNCEEVVPSVKWLLSNKQNCLLEIEQKLDDPIAPKVISKMNAKGEFETPAIHDMYPFIDLKDMEKLIKW